MKGEEASVLVRTLQHVKRVFIRVDFLNNASLNFSHECEYISRKRKRRNTDELFK